MNYLTLLKSLKKEAAASKQYELLGKPYNVLTTIALIPVFVMRLFAEVAYAILVFFFNGASSGIRYLENWVDSKKKDVNMATEAVLYFITTPAIFFFNVFFSLFSVFFYLIWFELQILYFITTLGGTKWQPFIMDAKFDDNTDYAPVCNITVRRVWSIVAFSLFVLTILCSLIAVGQSASTFIFLLYAITVTILVPIFFKKAPVSETNVEVATKSEVIASEQEPIAEENISNND